MRKSLRIVAIVLFPVVFVAGRAEAQRRGTGGPFVRAVERIGDREIREALRKVAADSRGVIFRSTDDGNAQYILNRRVSESEIETHKEWDDLLIVKSGYGVIRYGSAVTGGKSFGPGELRGGSFTSPDVIEVFAGDIVRIAAGMPHAVAPSGDAPLVYLVYKTRSARAGTSRR